MRMIRFSRRRKTHLPHTRYAIFRLMGKTHKHQHRHMGKGHEYGFGRKEEVHRPKQSKKSRKGNRKQQEHRAIKEGW